MLSGIIARLEKATGPDREIDEAIFEIFHGRKRNISTFEQYDPSERLPKYTASIDAALTLVPERAEWVAAHSVDGNLDSDTAGESFWCASVDESQVHYGKTPAIALCIAALKARSHSTGAP